MKDPVMLVRDNLLPFNKAYCNFLLNVAPNRQGLIDENVLSTLAKVGELWKPDTEVAKLPVFDSPIISHNLAKHQPSNATWSDDMWIMDFGNDDNFKTAWESNSSVAKPWYEVVLGSEQPFNLITLLEKQPTVNAYRLEYFSGNVWKPIPNASSIPHQGRTKVHRFKPVRGSRVRVLIDAFTVPPAIAELGVYNEKSR